MPSLLRPTKDPEIVALGVLALRSFARGTSPATPFEVDITRTLKDLGVSPVIARKLVANFDKRSPSVRRRVFGPLGLSDAQLPANIQRGSKVPDPLARRAVLTPGVLPLPKIFGDGGIQLPGEQILAPERYDIRFQGMHCVDETGPDFIGSDEIYIITSAVHIKPDGTNVITTVRHPLTQDGASTYGNVDSHETRIGPVASCWSAKVADTSEGMSISTVVMEHDEGDPNAYHDQVDAVVKLAIGIVTYLYPPAGAFLALIEASGLITDFFNWILGTGDDEIGTVTTILKLSELEIYSRTRLADFSPLRDGQHVSTGLRHHFLAPVNDNDYFVGFRVTRDPVAPLFPLPPVD